MTITFDIEGVYTLAHVSFFFRQIGDCIMGGFHHIWKVYIGGAVLFRPARSQNHSMKSHIKCYKGVTNYWWLSGTAHMWWPLVWIWHLFCFVLFWFGLVCLPLLPQPGCQWGNEGLGWDFPTLKMEQSWILVVTLTIVFLFRTQIPKSAEVRGASDQQIQSNVEIKHLGHRAEICLT